MALSAGLRLTAFGERELGGMGSGDGVGAVTTGASGVRALWRGRDPQPPVKSVFRTAVVVAGDAIDRLDWLAMAGVEIVMAVGAFQGAVGGFGDKPGNFWFWRRSHGLLENRRNGQDQCGQRNDAAGCGFK